MYVLIALALVSCTSVAHSQTDKPYLLASVLFYCDSHGETAVAHKVPMKIDALIRNDIKTRITNATVKVVPIFKDYRLSPTVAELMDFIKNRQKRVLIAELPAALATKLTREHKKRLNKKTRHFEVKKDKANYLNKAVHSPTDEAAIFKLVTEGRNSESKSADVKINALAEKFEPNSVYYFFETKCHLASEECDKLKASTIKKIPSVSFKDMFLKKAD